YIYRHSHLDGINPSPIIVTPAIDHRVDIFLNGFYPYRLWIDAVKIDIGHPTVLVIGMPGVHLATDRLPVMLFAPFYRIIVISFIRIDPVKCHEPFIIYTTRPDIRPTLFIGDDIFSRIGPLFHEII